MAKGKFKPTKQQQKRNESEENSKFFLIVALATIALVALMYFILR